MKKNSDRGAVFDQAMTGHHGGETAPMLDAYDFSGFQEVVDVGGGNGSLLAEMLERHPEMTGVLFDLPEVVERAGAQTPAPVAGRLRPVAGSFLDSDSIPGGGDAYILRHIVHDWNDEDTLRILRNTARAAAPDGRVLVVEMVLPSGNAPHFGKWLDLMMMAYGGRERTRAEYAALFEPAGLRLSRIVETRAPISIVEGVPVS